MGVPEAVPKATSAFTNAEAGAAGTALEVTGFMDISSPVTGSMIGSLRLTGFETGATDGSAVLDATGDGAVEVRLSDTLTSLEVVRVRCGCRVGPDAL